MEKKGHIKIRPLKASEIECRVAHIFKSNNGFMMLLYKDARCDMAVLDESVGNLNWERIHSRDNHNCTVRIWDPDKSNWVSKEDTGTESNSDSLKGLASDSFKRACFNWGIGRELYTSPNISIFEAGYIKNGKVFEKFEVTHIGYDDDRRISELVIADSEGKKVFEYPKGAANAQKRSEENRLLKYKGKVLEAMEKYDPDLVALVAEELGEAVFETVARIILTVPTRERLDSLGLEVKARADAESL